MIMLFSQVEWFHNWLLGYSATFMADNYFYDTISIAIYIFKDKHTVVPL